MKKLKPILLCMTLLAGSALAADPERKLIRREAPEYPALAEKMALHGSVKLKIWINPD
jgi:outer membrane biosynthesis protein TonB